MLRDIDEKGNVRDIRKLEHRDDFDKKWNEFTLEEQRAMNVTIDDTLTALIENPSAKWGSIMNTSIEGGKINPETGIRGDWSGTPWHPIYMRHDRSDELAALFFGTLWKLRIIERPELWVGI